MPYRNKANVHQVQGLPEQGHCKLSTGPKENGALYTKYMAYRTRSLYTKYMSTGTRTLYTKYMCYRNKATVL